MLSKKHLQIGITLIAMLLSACSGTKKDVVDDNLIIPPSLKVPSDIKPAITDKPTIVAKPAIANNPVTSKPVIASKPVSDSLYYIIVGTYPDQVEAIGTFSRISSIGLKQPAMESRRTKAGGLLHMVRLGPYSNQEDIDKAKDGLTNSGISGYKIVKN